MNKLRDNLVQPRVMRVFISSTFKDMQAERDELIKFVFPQLRKLCEQRGVTWGEVDLRWGITDEQSAEGKVLPICLKEIHRCRPYFIGILGERYGWIPAEIPEELIEREPWLAEHLGHSVTELEILHGVLNDPEMARHAFFYFRDTKYLETLPPEKRTDFFENDLPEDIKEVGQEEARRRTERRKRKLADLKERIRNSGFPVHEGYQDPKEFGQTVLQNLTAVIEDLYPEGSQPDPLDREAAEHEVFANSRAQVYIGRQTYFDELDAHARSTSEPLVVLGESGSGKSALLANWAIKYRKEHPDELVLMHFIGATPASADWAAMLRRILGEIKRKYDLQEEIPNQPEALRSAFPNWLNMAAARGRVVLVLDALNQLDDRDGAPDLVWLPLHIPENVRMLLTTLPGRPLDELKKRGWPTLTVEPLQPKERKRLIQEYLALFTKALSPVPMERIASSTQCRNPLFLRVLLDELRLFGVYERLGERIEIYLGAPTIPALYELILKRCEQDYERDRPGLVRDSMSMLWAARQGLSEAELLELLGAQGNPLPGAHWFPLYLALEGSLLNRNGLIGFAHDHLRQAVENRHLQERTARKQAHLRLADYFEAQSGFFPRRLDELPWQLARAEEWQRVYFLLGDQEFFQAAWEFDPFGVKAHWAGVEANSPYRMLDAYRKVISHPDQYGDKFVWDAGLLLSHTGHLEEAFALRAYLIEVFRQEGDKGNLANSLENQANVVKARGDLDGSMEMHKEAERIYRALGEKKGLALSLDNQGNILFMRGDLDGSMRLHKETERQCRETGNKDGLQRTLSLQANILGTRGDPDGALALYKEVERLCRELGNKEGLSNVFHNQAQIFQRRGDLDGAMVLNKESERLCRELGQKALLSASLQAQADILSDRGDLDGAMALYKETERICRELENLDGLSKSLGNQGIILAERGDLDGAMELQKEKERICRKLGDKVELANSLGNQANILSSRRNLDGAISLLKDGELICRETGDKVGLAAMLGNQAQILRVRGDPEGALTLHKEEERLCREMGDKAGLAKSLDYQGIILSDCGNRQEALALLQEAERICREMGIKDRLAHSLGAQALIFQAYRDLDRAMRLHEEEEQIYRALGDKDGLQNSLGNQALVLKTRGDLDGALALHREKERICRELGDSQNLAISLINQARILAGQGKTGEAHHLAEQSLKLAQANGYLELAQRIIASKNKLGI